ncbi:MAG: 6-phosphofructokinase, partial [Planctomycetes bacterium]|nr:6-phosphofructokinase [Planctomycetota bacterium]
YDKVPLEKVANTVRQLPPGWIAPSGIDVTDDFIAYAAPLIGDDWADVTLERGLPRFARLRVSFVDRKLPPYVPVRYR